MKKSVSTVMVLANENVAAFIGEEQTPSIQKKTIRQIFQKAFPRYDFKETEFLLQEKWR